MPAPPVFLFAYANDRVDDRKYLRNVPEELRRIKDALRAAHNDERCETIECPNATVDQVLSEAQDKAGALAAFHFAGHADGKTLLFEQRDGAANAAGAESIAEFLGSVGGLKLVVLNGCSTRAQVDALLAEGVATVVATSTLIKDDVATEFAVRFYRAIAGSASIAGAFRQASAAAKATFPARGEDVRLEHAGIRAVSRDLGPPAPGAPPPEWPWRMYGSKTATAVVLIGGRTTRPVWLLAVLIAVLAAAYGTYRYAHREDTPAVVLPPPIAAHMGDAPPAPTISRGSDERGSAATEKPPPNAPVTPKPPPPSDSDAAALASAISGLRAKLPASCLVSSRKAEIDDGYEVFVSCRCGPTQSGEYSLGTRTKAGLETLGFDHALQGMQKTCGPR